MQDYFRWPPTNGCTRTRASVSEGPPKIICSTRSKCSFWRHIDLLMNQVQAARPRVKFGIMRKEEGERILK